jgi:hypothetical protein
MAFEKLKDMYADPIYNRIDKTGHKFPVHFGDMYGDAKTMTTNFPDANVKQSNYSAHRVVLKGKRG